MDFKICHNTGMQPPSKKEAKGYDVVVWVDNDGDIVCRAFTEKGHAAMGNFVNKYERGDVVQIYCNPKEFIEEIPTDVNVGMLTNAGMQPFDQVRLH